MNPMARRYTLQPTRPDHPVKQRPFYREIRADVAAVENILISDLDAIERLVRRGGPPQPPPVPGASVDMLPLLQQVRDQGDQGSCFAFAGTACQALTDGLTSGSASQTVYAPADLSWNTRVLMGTTDQDSGGNLGDALLAMEQTGTCVEADMPYNPSVYATAPSSDAQANAATHKWSGRGYPIDVSDAANITNALADGYPVLLGFSVWTGFEHTGRDGVVPAPDGSNLGGHAQLFFAAPGAPAGTWGDQNSWGDGWGISGRCWFPQSGLSTIIEAYAMVSVSS